MPTDHAFLESIDLFAELDPQTRKKIARHFVIPPPFETSQRFAMRAELRDPSARCVFSQGPPGGTFFRDFMT
jgi:hypothetical protein